MLNLDCECFTVQNNSIVQGTLRDFERFIKEENTPYGIQRKFFIKQDNIGWALLYWHGGREKILFTFFNEQDALAELERGFAYDILGNNQFFIHLNRQSAENELHDSLEDQAL
jgi:hypothetical protein